MRYRLLTAITAVGVLAVAGCSGSNGSDSSVASSDIKIGFFSPMTGPTSQDGIDARNGAELAVSELSGAGKVKYTLAAYDDGGDPAQAVTIARKLAQNDKVQIVVSGGYSSTTAAVAPILQQFKIPLLSAYAVSPKITAAGDYIFRAGPAAATEGAAAAVFIKTKLPGSPQKVATVTADSEASTTLSQAMQAKAASLGLTVTSNDKFALTDTDFRPVLQKVKASDAQVIYLSAYYDTASAMINQAKELGITIPFLLNSGSDSPELFKLVKGSGMDGVYMTTDFPRGAGGPVQAFSDAYKAKYNAEASMVAASAYDAVKAAAAAIDAAGSTDGAAIRDAIGKLTNLNLVTGPVSEVTADRDFARPMHCVVVKDGAWTDFAQVPWDQIVGG